MFGIGIRRKLYSDSTKQHIHLIYVMAFLLAFSMALIGYTASTFFSDAWNTDNVGLIYVAIHLVSLFFFLYFHKFVLLVGKSVAFLLLVLSSIVLVVSVSTLGVSPLSSVFLAFYLAMMGLMWASLDSVLESVSTDGESGRIRGMFLVSMNTGIFMGPLTSTTLIDLYGFSGLFSFSAVVLCFLLIFGLLVFRKKNHIVRSKISIKKIIKKLKKRPDILFIYWIAVTLDSFFAILVIYTPIYLLHLGMTWQEIGLILSFALVPFILLQYPVGRIADKRLGEKEMIIVALTIVIVSVSFMPNLQSDSVFLWGLVLIVGRIGAALLEVLRDSYFYKRIDGEDVGIINVFRTARPVAYMLSSGISAIILLFFPLSQVFWIVVGMAVVALYPALLLKDNPSERERLLFGIGK